MGQETDKDLKKKHELGDDQLDKVSGGHAPGEGRGEHHIDPNERRIDISRKFDDVHKPGA
jgi:hypothetical protein